MSKGSDNPFPSLLFAETAAPAAPAAGKQRLFVDPADHVLKRIDSAGTITAVGSGGGGGGATDLNSLTDVVVGSEVLHEVLIWDGVEWTNQQIHLDYLYDVDTSTSPPAGGQFLWFDAVHWVPHTLFLDNCFDVNDPGGTTTGDVLTWNGSEWAPATPTGGGTAAGTSFSPSGGLSAIDVQAALVELDTEKATVDSPAFTGNPTAPTPAPGDSDTSIATTAFVAAAIVAGGGYTDEAARDAIGAALVQGSNITIIVNDAGDTITIGTTGLAPLASPVFTGDPKAPTPTAGDNDTSIATTAFVKAALDALVNSAPGTLDTLGEIAAQLATDESAASALTTSVAGKLAKASNLSDVGNAATALANLAGAPLASPALTGTPTAPTVAGTTDSTTKLATTAFVQAVVAALTDAAIAPVVPNDQTASYTAVLADGSRLVRISNAAGTTFTIPPNSSVAYPLGTVLSVAQQGAGQSTVTAGAGVTIRTPHGPKTSTQYAIVTATKVGTDEWYVSGDTST